MNRTAQREAILKELRSVKTHPTADELYAALRAKAFATGMTDASELSDFMRY